MADTEMQKQQVLDAIAGNSFCALATASAANRPHVVGVMYVAVDNVLYVGVDDSSIKARNIRQNPHVAVCIPVSQGPGIPPFCVQFQATAELHAPRDPAVAGLIGDGRLAAITGHGVLDDPETRIVRITPGRRVATYGVGLSLEEVMRDPIHASRSVTLR